MARPWALVMISPLRHNPVSPPQAELVGPVAHCWISRKGFLMSLFVAGTADALGTSGGLEVDRLVNVPVYVISEVEATWRRVKEVRPSSDMWLPAPVYASRCVIFCSPAQSLRSGASAERVACSPPAGPPAGTRRTLAAAG